jgi:hypothetical protein
LVTVSVESAETVMLSGSKALSTIVSESVEVLPPPPPLSPPQATPSKATAASGTTIRASFIGPPSRSDIP